MNLNSKGIYIIPLTTILGSLVHVGLFLVSRQLAAATILCCILATYSKKPTTPINYVPMINVVLMVWLTLGAWLLWSVAMEAYYVDNIFWQTLHAVLLSFSTIVASIGYSGKLTEDATTGYIFAIYVILMSMIPVNLATRATPLMLFAHVGLYTSTVFIMLILRIKFTISHNTLPVFVFCLWILSTNQTVISCGFLGLHAARFWPVSGEQAPLPSDPEAPTLERRPAPPLRPVNRIPPPVSHANLVSALQPPQSIKAVGLQLNIVGLED
jgi:hypothetical protein